MHTDVDANVPLTSQNASSTSQSNSQNSGTTGASGISPTTNPAKFQTQSTIDNSNSIEKPNTQTAQITEKNLKGKNNSLISPSADYLIIILGVICLVVALILATLLFRDQLMGLVSRRRK